MVTLSARRTGSCWPSPARLVGNAYLVVMPQFLLSRFRMLMMSRQTFILAPIRGSNAGISCANLHVAGQYVRRVEGVTRRDLAVVFDQAGRSAGTG